eukprot:TRINITY_DN35040_c0_g1_i1.p1 TRINITY_DN35040_c0_g1~~TRINITY_DN35040_c0_g1_i1.p1  ORF type:complete len:376 (-),score=71.43 TRINITY_DN35040_c0_g1_i1:67-1194(-)
MCAAKRRGAARLGAAASVGRAENPSAPEALVRAPVGLSSGEDESTASRKRVVCLQPQLRKTNLCSLHLEGKCTYGEKCAFAHSWSELQTQPDLSKTRMCDAFLEGKCTDSECTFAHGQEDMRFLTFFKTALCIWDQKGKCRNGDACRFAHGSNDLREAAPLSVDPRSDAADPIGDIPVGSAYTVATEEASTPSTPLPAPSAAPPELPPSESSPVPPFLALEPMKVAAVGTTASSTPAVTVTAAAAAAVARAAAALPAPPGLGAFAIAPPATKGSGSASLSDDLQNLNQLISVLSLAAADIETKIALSKDLDDNASTESGATTPLSTDCSPALPEAPLVSMVTYPPVVSVPPPLRPVVHRTPLRKSAGIFVSTFGY